MNSNNISKQTTEGECRTNDVSWGDDLQWCELNRCLVMTWAQKERRETLVLQICTHLHMLRQNLWTYQRLPDLEIF